jgi:S-(hydroxymethyl)glutathione dehydrogenase/alcohol dehydrogenase
MSGAGSGAGRAATVRAALVRGIGEPVRIVELDLPALGPHDVRVRLAAAGVCHSDLSMLDGTLTPTFPLVAGHEAAGEVVAVGADVSTVSPGDHVVLNWAPPCRACWHCLHGEPFLCSVVAAAVTAPGGWVAGEQVHHLFGIGAFAEEVVVPARAVVAVPAELPLELAALLGCAVLTGVGAVRTTARVRAGESVVVIGLGGVGLSAVLGARWVGAYPVIAVDVRADKEPLALALGATHFVPAGDQLARAIRGLTGGRGADHAFECVGRPSTIRAAWQSTRRGGQAVVIGVGGREPEVTFSPLELFHQNRRLTSSVYGSGDPERDIPVLAAGVLGGVLDLAPLITARIGLDGLDDAFARMRAGEGARSVVVFGTSSEGTQSPA